MTESSSTPTIKELSSALLEATLTDADAKNILNQIHQHFQNLIGISGFEDNMLRNAAVETKFGKALGLNHAAKCLIDYKRTTFFLRGLVAEIRKKQVENPGEQINIFYAGCGPYATFVTLVAPLFDAKEIRFSILDINAESIQFAKDLISKMGFSDYLDNYIQNDAITFKIEDPNKYHILFSETLDTMLYRECYVPIIWNMLRQLSKDVTLIPENVTLKLSFAREINGQITEDSPILIFDARESVEATKELSQLPDKFVPIRVPIDRISNIMAIVIDTDVQINKDLALIRDESDITRPTAFKVNPNIPFNTLVCTYFLSPEIELFIGTE